jgi:hypothetical protein
MRKKCIWNWNWHARKEIEYWDEWGKWHGFFTALSFIGSIIFIIGIPIPYLIEYFLRNRIKCAIKESDLWISREINT